jgi:hypothetical protein
MIAEQALMKGGYGIGSVGFTSLFCTDPSAKKL